MEVLRGYTGDRSAPQRFGDDEVVMTGVLPSFPAALFRRAGGGFPASVRTGHGAPAQHE